MCVYVCEARAIVRDWDRDAKRDTIAPEKEKKEEQEEEKHGADEGT